jgi:hypothetical protein
MENTKRARALRRHQNARHHGSHRHPRTISVTALTYDVDSVIHCFRMPEYPCERHIPARGRSNPWRITRQKVAKKHKLPETEALDMQRLGDGCIVVLGMVGDQMI